MIFIPWALALYAVTFLVTASRAMQAPRNLFRKVASRTFKGTELHNSFVHIAHGHVVLETDRRDEEDVKEIGVGYDFISCRMCVGFWLSLPILFFVPPLQWGAAYGLSYFLATQER